jgi:hypothetical protein
MHYVVDEDERYNAHWIARAFSTPRHQIRPFQINLWRSFLRQKKWVAAPGLPAALSPLRLVYSNEGDAAEKLKDVV